MKDGRLEKEFEEYFKGVNTPGDITADAKGFVKPKRRFMPKFVKFASIAASFILVFAVAITFMLKSDFSKKGGNDASLGNDNSPSAVPGDAAGFKFYTDADLSSEESNAYSLSSLNSSLKFIENLAHANNASVSSCKTGYANGKLALARADVSIITGLTRDDTVIYVEFTDENTIYGELADYYDGNRNYFRGAEYYLTETTAENGEPQFKLHISYKGVKYYFDVTSSDEKAYERYLNLIVK